MDSPRQDETEFRAWLTDGDVGRAAAWLVRRFTDEVLGLCVAMVRDRAVAEDLAQEVFGRAFEALAAFRGEASARTWILRIARNRCIDHLRAKKRDPWAGAVDDPAAEPDRQPDEAPLPDDLLLRRDEVEDALAGLSEGERALVVLRFKNGLSYAELADAFGLREGTVRMRVSRALARMRDALEAREPPMALDACVPAFAPAAASPPPAGPPGSPAPLPAPPAAPRRRASFAARIAGAFRGDPPAPPPSPPAGHPLARYFAATRAAPDALVAELLARLP